MAGWSRRMRSRGEFGHEFRHRPRLPPEKLIRAGEARRVRAQVLLGGLEVLPGVRRAVPRARAGGGRRPGLGWAVTSRRVEILTGARFRNRQISSSSPPSDATYPLKVDNSRSSRCSMREMASCPFSIRFATSTWVSFNALRSSASEYSSAISSAARDITARRSAGGSPAMTPSRVGLRFLRRCINLLSSIICQCRAEPSRAGCNRSRCAAYLASALPISRW